MLCLLGVCFLAYGNNVTFKRNSFKTFLKVTSNIFTIHKKSHDRLIFSAPPPRARCKFCVSHCKTGKSPPSSITQLFLNLKGCDILDLKPDYDAGMDSAHPAAQASVILVENLHISRKEENN